MTRWILPMAAVLGGVLPVAANAHFIWLVQKTENGTKQVHVYFSEDAEADDPSLLDRLKGMKVHQLVGKQEAKALEVKKGEESLTAPLPGDETSIVTARHEYGVISRGDAKYRLFYYAKAGPKLGNAAWTEIDAGSQMELDVVPLLTPDNKLQAMVFWQGKPLPKAEVTAVVPEVGDVKAESDEQGQAIFEIKAPGLYAIRARMIDETPGEHDGKPYDSVRRYSTVTFEVPENLAKTVSASASATNLELASLTPPVTSLGAAVVDDALYVYGGNLGSAHAYANDEQGHELLRLKLNGDSQWEKLAEGPGLQGLALVAHKGTLYRVGGFTAKNAKGEDNDLWSQSAVVAFDTAAGEWRDLPELPSPRSSHDAAVLGDTLYVVGGWALKGKGVREWDSTALAMDLSAEKPEWKELPAPPFERRALAVAAHDGKLFVIGGMDKSEGPTTKVAIYDPASQKWSEGPSLQGEPMEGFGASAFATGGALYVSTSEAHLQRLSADGSNWETVQELPRGRFFHRMLPVDDHRFVMVGGGNMEVGKFEEVEVVSVC